jgi:hypothetical protein
LTFIETARRSTALTSDESLAERLWAALEGLKIGSIARLKAELAKEQMADQAPGTPVKRMARAAGVSPRSIRNWKKESDGPMPKVPPWPCDTAPVVEAGQGEEKRTA